MTVVYCNRTFITTADTTTKTLLTTGANTCYFKLAYNYVNQELHAKHEVQISVYSTTSYTTQKNLCIPTVTLEITL